MERARAEAGLRDADRRKDDEYLAHELRNPLAPLRNGLQIARLAASPNPTVQRAMDMMDRQLSHLVRLVDDLLDVARITSGKLELRRKPELLAPRPFLDHHLAASYRRPTGSLLAPGPLSPVSSRRSR